MATVRAKAQLDATWTGGNATRRAERDVKGVNEATTRTKSGFASMAKASALAVGGFAGVAAGAVALGRGLQVVTTLAGEQQRVEAQLAATLESTGNAAGLSADELTKLASSLQATTTFGDEAIIASESLLLTFTKIGRDVFPRAQQAVLDMSTALGTDLKGQTLQLGKALNDPIAGIGALAEAGIQFTSSQKDTIKTLVEMGDVAGAQSVILKELETQFGGSAATAADTFTGRVQQLENVLGDVGEQLGDALLPALTNLAEVSIPAVVSASEGLAPTLEAFAQLAGVGTDLQASLTFWNGFGDGIEAALEPGVRTMNTLRLSLIAVNTVDTNNGFIGFLKSLNGIIPEVELNERRAARATEEYAASQAALNAQYAVTVPIVRNVRNESAAYSDEIIRLRASSVLSAEATQRMADAHDQFAPAANAATLALENESAAVQALFAGFEKLEPKLSGSFLDALTNGAEQTTSLSTATNDLNGFILSLATEAGATAAEMGFLATATGDYTEAQIAAAVKAIEFETRLAVIKQRFADGTISVYQFRDAVQDLFNNINNLTDKTVTVTVNTVQNGQVVTQGGSGPGISERASGGSVSGNRPVLVGENGPEIFVPPTNGSILNNNQTQRAFNGGSGSQSTTLIVQGREAAALALHDLRRRSRPASVLEL